MDLTHCLKKSPYVDVYSIYTLDVRAKGQAENVKLICSNDYKNIQDDINQLRAITLKEGGHVSYE